MSTGARGTLGLNYKLAGGSIVPLTAGVAGGIETLQARQLQIALTATTATCNAGKSAGHDAVASPFIDTGCLASAAAP